MKKLTSFSIFVIIMVGLLHAEDQMYNQLKQKQRERILQKRGALEKLIKEKSQEPEELDNISANAVLQAITMLTPPFNNQNFTLQQRQALIIACNPFITRDNTLQDNKGVSRKKLTECVNYIDEFNLWYTEVQLNKIIKQLSTPSNNNDTNKDVEEALIHYQTQQILSNENE